MNILVPITITDAMMVSSTIAEPSGSETAWVSAGTYVLGDQRIRTTTHRVYECILGHTGRAQLPEDDPLYWENVGPTAKWAPFDTETSTAASAASSLTYVLSPGFFDAVSAYGLTGSELTLTVKDGPGGTVLETRVISLYEEAGGLYEYLFATARPKRAIIASGLPIHPTAELTATVAGLGTVSAGMINVGQYRKLVTSWGGTEYGATVEPTTYSRIKTDEFGTTTIKRGHAASGLRASVVLPLADANYALQTIQQTLDTPVTFVASEGLGYEGLNVFGLGSATLGYAGPSHVQLNITVKGMI